MEGNKATRRGLLRFFAALPVTAWLLRPDVAAAQASRMVVFNGVQANAPAEGPAAHVWGWAAETPQGWIGRVVDAQVATARRDYPGFAAGVTMVTPKGTSNTINGTMDNDGIRAQRLLLRCHRRRRRGLVLQAYRGAYAVRSGGGDLQPW